MNRHLDVGVVGCGTAGPALALFLARAGHAVTLYERVPAPAPVGAGIILQPTGQRVLARLGLADDVIGRGARLEGLTCQTSRGRTILDLSYAGVGADLFGVGLHRGALFEALFGALKRAPITMQLGVDLRAIARRGRAQSLVDTHGDLHGAHDLVVIADGARSQLRDTTANLLPKSVHEYPWGALWCVMEDREESFAGRLHQVVNGTREMAGFLPTGLGPTGRVPLVTIYWSLRADRVDAWREAGLETWKGRIRALEPRAAAVLDTITDPSQLLFTRYHDVRMRRWHTHELVYIGDAAHAMSPQLGQGCNLALYDAMILADAIEEHENIADALAAYSSARHAHLFYYQNATRWLMPFFQSDLTPLGPLRDLGMSVLSSIAPFRREMTLAMCGTRWAPQAAPEGVATAGGAPSSPPPTTPGPSPPPRSSPASPPPASSPP